MTSRERVALALAGREPDRVPMDIGGTFLTSAEPEMQERLADLLGFARRRVEVSERTGQDLNLARSADRFDERIQEHFGCDLRSITPAVFPDWGFKEVHEAPMRNATVADIERYPWPEPRDEMVKGVREEAKCLHEQTGYFVCASQIGQGVFEAACYLRGYERILYDFADDEGWVHAFMRKFMVVNTRLGDLYFPELGENVDMILFGDDLATQMAPYMSPAMFRRLVKPYFAEYVASIRKHCPKAVIAHHCCGASFPLLEDLMEIGVQVINPVQTTARGMEMEALATKKPRLGFLGGVDLQHVLPHGTRDEVEEFVRRLIRHLAPGGNLILAACHTLPHDVKPENVIAMFEAALKWGKYPIAA